MGDLRHSRSSLLDGVGEQGISFQLQTRVGVLGCGGVGQAVAGALGAAGLGELDLMDAECVSATNIGRLPLMQASDVGRPKVEALGDAIRRNNPQQKLRLSHQVVTHGNILEMCEGVNIMVDTSDNWPTRKMLAKHCRSVGIPLISGGALATDGWVGVFPPDGPTLESWLGQPQQMADSCERVGVLGPLVGVVGNLMAMEALKLMWRQAFPTKWQGLQGCILYVDGRYGEVRMQPLG